MIPSDLTLALLTLDSLKAVKPFLVVLFQSLLILLRYSLQIL